MSQMPKYTKLDRAYHGEQNIGFFLGNKRAFFVDGPGGDAGHAPNAPGADGCAYQPHIDTLTIYDNKSWKDPRAVGKATAIDPEANLAKNLDDLIASTRAKAGVMPYNRRILDLLLQTRRAVAQKRPWPPNVVIAVSNAGGQSTGVSARLTRLGVRFIDYYEEPARRVSSLGSVWSRLGDALRNPETVQALGWAAHGAAAWLNDLSVRKEVGRRLETDLAPAIRDILNRGQGVLVVTMLRKSDIEEIPGGSVANVFVQGGNSYQEALAAWQRGGGYFANPPEGWHLVTDYGWIPPGGYAP